MKFTIIGINDNKDYPLPQEVRDIIYRGQVFSGGKRHHELMAHLLPEHYQWIDITVPLSEVFHQYQPHEHVIVFASGDPLFFGFANTVRRNLPDAEITLFPAFNSLQMLAHRLLIPYHDMRIVSLTGRPWHEFDRALIEGCGKIGVLTDGTHTPAAIAERMLDYGYHDYRMTVGEHLGNPEKERVRECTLKETASLEFSQPNCLILTGSHQRRWGIPDHEFELLNGRERMITKMPIRLLSLQALELPRKQVMWDIGFCTGSISIETRLQFPHLHVVAFEIREEGRHLMETNARRFGAPGIDFHIGDFLTTDTTTLPQPDAVFIGGHGGKLCEIMKKAAEVLLPGGCIVMNSVTEESKNLFMDACQTLGLELCDSPMQITINAYNPIEILKCKKLES